MPIEGGGHTAPDFFQRATPDGQDRGLGLGLSIVQQVLRAHGGTSQVHSTQAEGTTFTVRLPRCPPPALP